MRQACDNFQLATKSYAQSPALYHNLGVCAEIKNDLEQASSLYTQAASLSEKPVDLITKALARVNDRQAKNQQVAGQLH